MKRKTQCPVKRINADALHFTILQQIEHAAKHHTVLHKLIAESGGWRDGDDAAQSRRAELSKQKQFLGVRIVYLTDLIADGSKSARSLLDKLVEIEEQRDGHRGRTAELGYGDQGFDVQVCDGGRDSRVLV